MTTYLGMKSWAAGALVLVAVTACTNGDREPAPPDNPSSASSASSPTSTSLSDVAAADATETMREYFTVLDEVGEDPAAGLQRLKTVAVSTQLGAVETLLRRQHGQGQRQVGTTEINELIVQSVSLDNSAPATGKAPTVVIDVCWDVSTVDVLDKDGQSIVSPSRPDTGWTRYTVANYEYTANPDTGWRVAAGRDLKRAPCPVA